MKRLLLIHCLVFCAALPAAAQIQNSAPFNLQNYDYKYRWRFGFSIGLNVFDYTAISSMRTVQPIGYPPMILKVDMVAATPGFNINGIANYRLSQYFDLRALPGICFGSRILNYYTEDGELHHAMNIESNYIELPLLLKASARRTSNYRPYLVAGFNSRFNLNWKTAENKGIYISSTIYQPHAEMGAGLDMYFFYFKLSFEIKYSVGFTNNLGSAVVERQEAYRDAISRLNSQIFVFAIHIE